MGTVLDYRVGNAVELGRFWCWTMGVCWTGVMKMLESDTTIVGFDFPNFADSQKVWAVVVVFGRWQRYIIARTGFAPRSSPRRI
jgi:hypothetical protein